MVKIEYHAWEINKDCALLMINTVIILYHNKDTGNITRVLMRGTSTVTITYNFITS